MNAVDILDRRPVGQAAAEAWARIARRDGGWMTVTTTDKALALKLGLNAYTIWRFLVDARTLHDDPLDGGFGCVTYNNEWLARKLGYPLGTFKYAMERLLACGLVVSRGWKQRPDDPKEPWPWTKDAVHERCVRGRTDDLRRYLVHVPVETAQWLMTASDSTHGGARRGAGRKRKTVPNSSYPTPPAANSSEPRSPNSSEPRVKIKREETKRTNGLGDFVSKTRAGGPSREGERSVGEESLTPAAKAALDRLASIPFDPLLDEPVVAAPTTTDTAALRRELAKLPLYGSPANGLYVEVPSPPTALPDDPEVAVRMLTGWAATLIEAAARTGKKHWPLRKLNAKSHALALACVAALAEHDVPPIDFLFWQLATWDSMQESKHAGEKPKPPPVAWLLSTKRVEAASHCTFNPLSARLYQTPAAKKFSDARRVSEIRGIASQDELNRLREAWGRAVDETRMEQARIRDAVTAGRFVWR